MSLKGIRLKSNLWHLESMVAGILCTSVVANMKAACGGGSSSVFKSALKAAVESMCTSSMMYILYLPRVGTYLTLSRSSRTLSTPVLDAPSISKTSTDEPEAMVLHDSQLLHGVGVGPSAQLRHLARILAAVVLPTPLGPEKR